jgi:hypothetical protein
MSQRAYTEDDYRIVVALTDQGASLAEIVAATGVSKRTIARMRNGEWEPPRGPSMPLLGDSRLTSVIAHHIDDGYCLDDLTVLAHGNDPFRQDTDEGHKLGKWLRDTLEGELGFEVGEDGRTIHNRGLHYLLIGQLKPDGSVYQNSEREWKWLSDRVSKAARWLGYVPFEQVTDQRNAGPVIRERPPEPEPAILTGYEASALVPGAEDFAPAAYLDGAAVQPCRLAVIGEKSSLEPVLGPVADESGASLYLPTGEISDTQLHRMAALAVADGRPLICLYFSDSDPSGWQMPISVSRKLQALSELLGPLEFEVHRVALTPDQVRELGLPSTPLKDTERRAAKWEARTGTQQTEIDAAIALRPGELAQIAREAIAPFFDASLAGRFGQARQAWLADAQQVIDDGLDGDREQILAAARVRLSRARALIDEVNESLQTSAGPDDLPAFEPPEPDAPIGDALPSGLGTTLVSSRWDFADQCRALKGSKAYGGEDENGDGDGDG